MLNRFSTSLPCIRAKFLALIFVCFATYLSAQQNENLNQDSFMSPSIEDFRLENGLRLIVQQTDANEVIALACLIEPGAMFDEDGKAGASNLMMRVLTKGTKSRTSFQISEDLQDIGARLSASSGYDYLSLSLQSVRDEFPAAMGILRDIALNPTFPVDEIETEKQRILGEMKVRDDRSASMAFRKLREKLFDPSRYSLPIEGMPETVFDLTQVDLVTTWKRRLRPENMTISIVGNISRQDAEKLVRDAFGDLELQSRAQSRIDQKHTMKGGLVQIDRDVEQAFIAIGVRTCDVTDDDIPAVELASTILGGGMSSRLFTELRDKRGLAYSVGSRTSHHRGDGYMAVYIGTSPDRTCESIDGLWEQIVRLQQEPVAEDELQRAKNYLLGGTLRGMETNYSQASSRAYFGAVGLGPLWVETFREKISAVSTKDVMRVANKYFNDPATVIIHPQLSSLECLHGSSRSFIQEN